MKIEEQFSSACFQCRNNIREGGCMAWHLVGTIIIISLLVYMALSNIPAFGLNIEHYVVLCRNTDSINVQLSSTRGGGLLTRKMYAAKPLPSVAQHFQDLTLTGTKFGPKSIPLVAQILKIEYLLWHNFCSKVVYWCGRVALTIRPI